MKQTPIHIELHNKNNNRVRSLDPLDLSTDSDLGLLRIVCDFEIRKSLDTQMNHNLDSPFHTMLYEEIKFK
jgi:hypothetical protein